MLYILYIILLIIKNCLPALLATIFIEGIFVLVVTKKRKYVSESILCNVITNPVVNVTSCLIFIAGGNDKMNNLWVAVAEILVVFVETYIYRKRTDFDVKKCFWLAYTANLFSLSLFYFISGKYIQGILPVMLYVIVSAVVSVYQRKKSKRINEKAVKEADKKEK